MSLLALNKTIPYRKYTKLGRWFLLFVGLVSSIWAASLSPHALQLMLLALLYLCAVNFSASPSQGSVGLIPIVAMSSMFIIGLDLTLILVVSSTFLAALVYPLWDSIRYSISVERLSWIQRLCFAPIQLASLVAAGYVYQLLGGTLPPSPIVDGTVLWSLTGLSMSYGVVYSLMTLGLWQVTRKVGKRFPVTPTIILGFFSHPIALLGGIAFSLGGIPVFVVFCVGIMAASLIVWLSWHRRMALEQQLEQLIVLNVFSESLRETLDLPTILTQTCHQVLELLPVSNLSITLRNDDESWSHFDASAMEERPPHLQVTDPSAGPDDMTRWVVERGRVLELNQTNFHFAQMHGLTAPEPFPDAWLGVPLMVAEESMGAMVVQRAAPGPPFGSWGRELLLAIAGHASAAIQNARLYGETLRLYDMTDAALSRRVEQLQALLDAMQEGVLMIDSTGSIVLANSMAAALLNESPSASLQGRKLDSQMAIYYGFSENEFHTLLSELASGRLLANREDISFNRLLSADGDTRQYIQRVEKPVVNNATGKLIGWLMLFRDITEEKELVELRTDLTRMIVHDLRNPLTTLTSTIELIQQAVAGRQATTSSDNEYLGDWLGDALRGCQELLDMVDSLMDISRLDTGQNIVEAEAMRLSPLIERTLMRMNPLIQTKAIRVAYEVVPELPAVWADEELVRRVFVNLLDNALKFTPAEGLVEVCLQTEPALPNHESGVRCTISDTGPGVPEKYRDRIFDIFMRTNRGGAQVRGTGLGLSFCRKVIDAHGGRIWVEDAPGGGSRFIFTLPGIPEFD